MLLISSDLPEVIGLSHRLALYRDGRILRELGSARADPVDGDGSWASVWSGDRP